MKVVEDHVSHIISMQVQGLDTQSMMEQARLHAARIWEVDASRVVVQLGSITVASRDPFPTDLSNHAAVDMLSSNAVCIRVKESGEPDDRL